MQLHLMGGKMIMWSWVAHMLRITDFTTTLSGLAVFPNFSLMNFDTWTDVILQIFSLLFLSPSYVAADFDSFGKRGRESQKCWHFCHPFHLDFSPGICQVNTKPALHQANDLRTTTSPFPLKILKNPLFQQSVYVAKCTVGSSRNYVRET